MVVKAQKSHGTRPGLYGICCNGVPPNRFFQVGHRIQFRSRPHTISGLFHLHCLFSPVETVYFTSGVETNIIDYSFVF
jgi:hypothetical protein